MSLAVVSTQNVSQIVWCVCVLDQLALSAACPIIRGYLLDTDCRWDIISASVDDRTREERGLDVRRQSYSY